MPVLSANQVTMWAALRRSGYTAVGPYQALLLAAESGPNCRPAAGPPAASAPPALPEEQEGWT